MAINAILPGKGRDLRLDLFRCVANWWIFLDHILNNVLNWLMIRTDLSRDRMQSHFSSGKSAA